MSVQNLTESLNSLYLQGKYKDCLARIEEARKADLPTDERIAALIIGGRIKRELTELLAAADMLEHARDAAGSAKDPLLEPSVELALNAVHSSLMKNKSATRSLVKLSEKALERMRNHENGKGSGVARGSLYAQSYLHGLCDLGITMIYAGEIFLAGQHFRTASGIAQESFGADSPEMIYPLVCLAVLHSVEEKHSLSMGVARNAAMVARANFGRNHPLLIHPLYLLAQAATRHKLFQEALDACRQVEGLIIDYIGEESDIYVDLLGMKSAAFLFLIEHSAAEVAASKRLQLMEKMRGKNNPKLIDPLCDLAQALVGLGERDKAEKHFDRALKLVDEATKDRGFPEAFDALPDAPATAGSRLNGGSLCHVEYELIERLGDCYLWQGKIADVARLMPSSMRSRHLSRFDYILGLIEWLNKQVAALAPKDEFADIYPAD